MSDDEHIDTTSPRVDSVTPQAQAKLDDERRRLATQVRDDRREDDATDSSTRKQHLILLAAEQALAVVREDQLERSIAVQENIRTLCLLLLIVTTAIGVAIGFLLNNGGL
jgi:hypothetical protein